jgi:hypothetical protein
MSGAQNSVSARLSPRQRWPSTRSRLLHVADEPERLHTGRSVWRRLDSEGEERTRHCRIDGSDSGFPSASLSQCGMSKSGRASEHGHCFSRSPALASGEPECRSRTEVVGWTMRDLRSETERCSSRKATLARAASRFATLDSARVAYSNQRASALRPVTVSSPSAVTQSDTRSSRSSPSGSLGPGPS